MPKKKNSAHKKQVKATGRSSSRSPTGQVSSKISSKTPRKTSPATPLPSSNTAEKSKMGNTTLSSRSISILAAVRSPLDLMSDTNCREVACEGLASSVGYCRLHYIKNWKKIKRKESILREKKLDQYIEELVAKYPDKYIEAIREDLENDKDFAKVISDLDLDEGIDDFEVEGGDSDSLIDTIKREFDDEVDAF